MEWLPYCATAGVLDNEIGMLNNVSLYFVPVISFHDASFDWAPLGCEKSRCLIQVPDLISAEVYIHPPFSYFSAQPNRLRRREIHPIILA
jgi:hypothetical protein